MTLTASEANTCKSGDLGSNHFHFEASAPKAPGVTITASEASTCKSADSGSISLTFRSVIQTASEASTCRSDDSCSALRVCLRIRGRRRRLSVTLTASEASTCKNPDFSIRLDSSARRI